MSVGLLLLTLPIEVRLQVFKYLFTGQAVRANAVHYSTLTAPEDAHADVRMHTDPIQPRRTSLQPLSWMLNIILTCKQLHTEALPVFYSFVRFTFRRHSIDEINWRSDEVRACFPSYTTQMTAYDNAQSQRSINLVRRVFYAGNDPDLIRNVSTLFPALTSFEFDLDWDHSPGDQTNFDYAIKYLKRHKEWRTAIKDAVDQRFPNGMTRAVFDLQKQGPARGFPVTLHWRVGWRFLEFAGDTDLDEWVLRLYNADLIERVGLLEKHYFKQDPIFHEMG